MPWGKEIPVPSRTPFVHSLVTHDKDVIPVYDLAAQLRRGLGENSKLCLVARHADGPMAVCIDADIPSLHTIAATQIKQSGKLVVETLGSFERDGEEIEIVALQQLGMH